MTDIGQSPPFLSRPGMNILRIGMGYNGSFMNSNGASDIQKAKARGAKYIIGTLRSPPADFQSGRTGR